VWCRIKSRNRWPKRFCSASSVRAGKWIFLRKRASWCWRCPKKYRPEVGTHPGRLASACPVSNPAFAQVVGGQLHLNLVAGQNADVVLTHLAGNMSRYYVPIFQFYPEHRIRKGINYLTFHFNVIIFCHSSPV